MNYFKLLGIEEKYDIDLRQLNKQYLSKQAIYHPDRARNTQNKIEYQDISINLNKAYSILKDDFKRAEYILSLSNIFIDDPALRDKISAVKLSEILEEREAIEDTDNVSELQKLLETKLIERQNLIAHLKDAFDKSNFSNVLDIVIGFKYLENLIENIKLKIKNASN